MMTAKVQLTEALKTSTECWLLLVESMPDALVIHQNGKIRYANPAAARTFGVGSNDDLVGKDILDFVHPDSLKNVRERIREVLETGQPAPIIEEKLLRPDGSMVMAEVTGSAIAYQGSPAVQVVICDKTSGRQAETDFRTLFEQSPLSMQIIGRDGRTLRVNQAWKKLWGIELEAIAEFNVLEDEQLRAKGATPYLERVFAGDAVTIPAIEFVPRESAHVPPRTRARWARAWAYPLRKGAGEIEQAVLVHEDITGRKQAEEKIKAYRNRLNTIIETSSDIIFLKDRELRYLVANKAHEKLFDIKAADMIGKTDFDFMPQEAAELCRRSDELALKSRDFVCKEECIKGRWFEATKHAVLDGSGNVTGIVGAIRDITGRKQAEAWIRGEKNVLEMLTFGRALREVLDLLSRLVEEQISQARCFVSRLDSKTQRLKVVSAPSLPGSFADSIERTGIEPCTQLCIDASKKREIAIVEDIAANPQCASCKDAIASLGLKTCWTSPVHNSTDQIIGAFSVYHPEQRKPSPAEQGLMGIAAHIAGVAIERKWAEDTLRKHREHLEEMVQQRTEELELAKNQAESSNRAKSAFLANMSHELRTPLNPIIGFAEMMSEGAAGEMSDQQKQYARGILDSGRHLLELINDILDLSKVEASAMQLELAEYSPKEVVNAAIFMLSQKAKDHAITLSARVDEEIGTGGVGDERRIRQVLFNLASNAVKFTPDGGKVRISARKVRSAALVERSREHPSPLAPPASQDADFIEFSVADTGIGINSEDQARLFQPFTQLEPPLSKQYEGTGLGLVLSKRLVEMHGGSIHVKSAPGKGSVFSFTIPVKAVHKKPVVDAAQ